jgi:hypothetical protein
MAPAGASWARLDADEIEQRIIRAYIQLICTPRQDQSSSTVTITRLGRLEVRLTKAPLSVTRVPLFWLEFYSRESKSVVVSYEYRGFDEDDELAAAVEAIMSAEQRAQLLH